MGNPVVIKPKTPAAANGKAAAPAGKKAEGKQKKPRVKKEKPEVKITLDEQNIPNIADEAGNLVIGISPKQFFAFLTEEQKKDKNIRHAAKTRAMEYAVHMAQYRLNEHTEKKNPKKKLMGKYQKMLEKMKAMKAELGDEVPDVEDVEA